MKCIKCKLRKWYYTLLKWVMLPVRSLAGGINIEDQVVATLIKDGEIIERVVGPKMHNLWQSGTDKGLTVIKEALRLGCVLSPTATPLLIKNMQVGSQCSDTAFTQVGATQVTANTSVSNVAVKATAEWAESPAVNAICQARINIINRTGGATAVEAAIYNFGTSFDKPNGVALKIEWTVTLTP